MTFTALQSTSGSAGVSASTITFGDNTAGVPIRYAYVLVQNTATSGIIYVRTDGTAATTSGDKEVAVAAGQSVLVANGLPWWSQAANVIPFTTSTASGFTTNQGTDAENYPYGSSFYGQIASPGTSVSIIASAASTGYTISGTG